MSAWETKDPTNLMRSAAVQADRDKTTCTCGHPNSMHGYGTGPGSVPEEWPDGSRIGLGQCGAEACGCQAFHALSATGAKTDG